MKIIDEKVVEEDVVDEWAKIPVPPKFELEDKYVHQGMTTTEIGNYYRVSNSLVSRWLNKLGIKRPTQVKRGTRPDFKPYKINKRKQNVKKFNPVHVPKLDRADDNHSLADITGPQELGADDYRFNADDYRGHGSFDYITPFGIDEYDTDGQYSYKDELFDSSWELAYYIYNIDHDIEIEHNPTHFTYYVDGEEHVFVPDFKKEKELIEIISKQRLKALNKTEIGKARYKCMTDHKVSILTYADVKPCIDYVNETYGEDYLDKYKLDDEEER